MLKYLINCQELMKQGIQNGMKHVSVNVDQMQVFLIINNNGIMRNVNVNVKNSLIKVYAINDIFGIIVIVNAKVINHVILVSIQTMKIVNVEKDWQIN